MKLEELLKGIEITGIAGDNGVEITGVTKDSRQVRPGYLFCITEKNEPYIDDVRRMGAVAVVSEKNFHERFAASVRVGDIKAFMGSVATRFYGYPSKDIVVIGITGTNGKTTTTYLLESILKKAGKRPGVVGTISYRYEGKEIRAVNTTPGITEIQNLFRDMVTAGTDVVAMEVSSHALDQRRVEGIDFDVAVFTNLTHDHLDYHGTIDNYKDAKQKLFHYYLPKSTKEKKYAILNVDDPNVAQFVPAKPVETCYYSVNGNADASLLGCQEDIAGLNIEISLMGRKLSVQSPLIGTFNAANILAASLAAHVIGVSHEEVASGIKALEGVPGRLERVRNNRNVSIFIDYAHTPDALRKVIEILSVLKEKRLIVVFGCGGDRDRAKRPVMGGVVTELADVAIITSDNPRGEDPQKIIEDIVAGAKGNTYRVVPDRREAIHESVRIAGPNDIILIAGKGHEDYQIIGGETFHFSDREVVEEAFGLVS